MTAEQLTGALNSVGEPNQTWVTPEGSRLVLIPHGGRVLGLFAASGGENFYWTNPALSSAARDFVSAEGRHDFGGDRTWLAPEIDLYFPASPSLTLYKVPAEIDPGKYKIENSEPSPTVVNRANLRFFRSRQTAEIEIRKSWTSAANPLRYEKLWDQMSGVQYAGYTQTTSLKFADGQDKAGPIGAWNLIQLPHGGTAVFPLHSHTEPTIYFGSIPPDDLAVKDHAVTYKMQASGIQKIGVRAAVSTGRAAYLYSKQGQSVLVVRNVFIDPGAEYVDVPWDDSGKLGQRGCAFQACNLNTPKIGTFSELEYHAPAIGIGTGRSEYEDSSQVWAFRGPEKLVRMIGRSLVSADF